MTYSPDVSLETKDLIKFRYDTLEILCPRIYTQFLEEVFILDVYRADLLNERDLVLDLGAGTGDFSILASKKIGNKGKVLAIEPNEKDFNLLRMNIQRNDCKNIIPLNMGIGGENRDIEMSFRGRNFRFTINTLEYILDSLKIKDNINFVKIDIEGFEAEVLKRSIENIKNADVISVEFHGTQQIIHELLVSNGFFFTPVTTRHIYKKIIENMISHPYAFCKLSVQTTIANPSLLRQILTGFNITNKFLTGTYVKNKKLTQNIA